MNLKETIEYLKNGTRHYNLIVVNQESRECTKECKSLEFEDIIKINLTQKLIDEILVDKTQKEKNMKHGTLLKIF